MSINKSTIYNSNLICKACVWGGGSDFMSVQGPMEGSGLAIQ